MCTYEETKQAVNDVIHEKDDSGTTVIGREVNKHIDDKFRSLNRWLFGGGITLVAVATAMWVNNENRLKQVEKQLDNADIWTQTEQGRYQAEVNRRFLELTERFDDFESDIRLIRQATVGY